MQKTEISNFFQNDVAEVPPKKIRKCSKESEIHAWLRAEAFKNEKVKRAGAGLKPI